MKISGELVGRMLVGMEQTVIRVAAEGSHFAGPETGTVRFREPVNGIAQAFGLLPGRALGSWETFENTPGPCGCRGAFWGIADFPAFCVQLMPVEPLRSSHCPTDGKGWCGSRKNMAGSE